MNNCDDVIIVRIVIDFRKDEDEGGEDNRGEVRIIIVGLGRVVREKGFY